MYMINKKGPLTERQMQVLKLIAEGKKSNEIGLELCISPRTVERHAIDMRMRMQAKNLPHLISICYQKGLIELKIKYRG